LNLVVEFGVFYSCTNCASLGLISSVYVWYPRRRWERRIKSITLDKNPFWI
jgi:hypothetical protein